MTKFKKKYPQYEFLKRRWVGKHAQVAQNLVEKHTDSLKHITVGGLSGLMLLSSPTVNLLSPPPESDDKNSALMTKFSPPQIEKQPVDIASDLATVVPQEVRKLTPQEESQIGDILSTRYGMDIKASIDGKRLNRSYGLIGGEQHLYRYPGDSVFKHAETASDWAMYGGSGIAPGLGAYGYFTPSESQFSKKDEERERYYIAVQTFLSPGFNERVGEYRDFYKFRKMLLVNPKTGQAVVTVIGDAGPAEWTGKHLGGSPEVMHYVGHAKGPRKGPVLYFFIDDPEDKIPLGPISVNNGGKI